MQLETLITALKEAGYTKVNAYPGARPKTQDIVCFPGELLSEKTRNFAAIPVLADNQAYAILRYYAGVLILSNVSSTAPGDQPAKPAAKPAAQKARPAAPPK